jgi:hypothetical protein
MTSTTPNSPLSAQATVAGDLRDGATLSDHSGPKIFVKGFKSPNDRCARAGPMNKGDRVSLMPFCLLCEAPLCPVDSRTNNGKTLEENRSRSVKTRLR